MSSKQKKAGGSLQKVRGISRLVVVVGGEEVAVC